MPKEYFIPPTTEVIFVADLYSNEYIGGAELTTDAIINCSKKNVFKLHSESLTPELVQKNTDKYWVLCNWNQSPIEGRIQLVQSGCKYSIIEYDYKYCKYRSSHLHKLKTQVDCDCHTDSYGKWLAGVWPLFLPWPELRDGEWSAGRPATRRRCEKSGRPESDNRSPG